MGGGGGEMCLRGGKYIVSDQRIKKKLSCVMKQRNVFNSDDIMLRNKETTRTFWNEYKYILENNAFTN